MPRRIQLASVFALVVLTLTLPATAQEVVSATALAAGEPQQINDPSSFRQVAPVAAALDGGGFVAVWEDLRLGVVGRFVDGAGAAVGGSLVLAANTPFPEVAGRYEYIAHRQPAVAALPGGGFLVAWTRREVSLSYSYFRTDEELISSTVWVRAFNRAGAPTGDAFPVAGGLRQEAPAMAAPDRGSAVVIWQQRSNRERSAGVLARLVDPAGGTAGRLVRVAAGASIAAHPQVTAAPGGGFLAAWTGADGDGAGIQARLFGADGTAAGPAVVVNGTETGGQGGVTLAARDRGFLAAWQHTVQAPDEYRLRGRFLDAAGQPVGAELALTPELAEADGAASLVALPDGGYHLYWLGWSERFPRWILGQALDASGAPVGEPIQVSSRRPQSQHRLGVAAGEGGVLVTWEGFEGQNRGISARAFRLPERPAASLRVLGAGR